MYLIDEVITINMTLNTDKGVFIIVKAVEEKGCKRFQPFFFFIAGNNKILCFIPVL